MRAYRFSTSAVPGSPNTGRATANPAVLSTRSRQASAPPSFGVTEGQRNSSRAMAIGSADMVRASYRGAAATTSGASGSGATA